MPHMPPPFHDVQLSPKDNVDSDDKTKCLPEAACGGKCLYEYEDGTKFCCPGCLVRQPIR